MTLTELIARFKAKIPFATNAAPVNQKLVADELVAVGLAFEAQQSTNQDVAIELAARALVDAGLRTDLNAALVRIAALEEGAGTPTKAATPTAFAAGTPTTTTVPLSWAGPTGATYVVQRGLTSDFNVTTPVYTGAATTTTATGLTASTGYYARVKAQVAGLTDSDWATLQVTTAADAPDVLPMPDVSDWMYFGLASNPNNTDSSFKDLSGHGNHLVNQGTAFTYDEQNRRAYQEDFGDTFNTGLTTPFSDDGTAGYEIFFLVDNFDPYKVNGHAGSLFAGGGLYLQVNDPDSGAYYTAGSGPVGTMNFSGRTKGKLLWFSFDPGAGTGKLFLDGNSVPKEAGTYAPTAIAPGVIGHNSADGNYAFRGKYHGAGFRRGVYTPEQRATMSEFLLNHYEQIPAAPDFTGQKGLLLAPGDSRTLGYYTDGSPDVSPDPYPASPPAKLQVAYNAAIDVVNLGKGGSYPEEYLINHLPDLAALNDRRIYRAVVAQVAFGINDLIRLGGSTPLSTLEAFHLELLHRLDNRGITILDATCSVATASTQPRHNDYQNFKRAYAAANPSWIKGLADIDAVVTLQNPANTTKVIDGIHYTASGSDDMAKCEYQAQLPVWAALGITVPAYAPWG